MMLGWRGRAGLRSVLSLDEGAEGSLVGEETNQISESTTGSYNSKVMYISLITLSCIQRSYCFVQCAFEGKY